MKHRSHNCDHGAVRAPHTRHRPIVGSAISARSSLDDTARPQFPPAPQPARSSRPRRPGTGVRTSVGSMPRAPPAPLPRGPSPCRRSGSSTQPITVCCGVSPASAARERAEQIGSTVLVDRSLHQLPHVLERERCAARDAALRSLRRAAQQRLDRLDGEPALVAPVAQRRTVATRAAPARARRRASR